LYRTEVVAARGDSSLEAIDLHDSATGETSPTASGGLFIFIGADAETAWLPQEIALDRHGFVLTGSELQATGQWKLERDPYLLETSVPGIFACGDVRSGPVKRVAASVGEGSMAIAFVHQSLRDPGWAQARSLGESLQNGSADLAHASSSSSATGR
jgi:thioredoxin reductase (NADPH)